MSEADYNRQRIIHMAKKHAEDKECPRCRVKGKFKVVPIHEYGDLEMPSKVILMCDSCKKYDEVFAAAPDDQARAFAEEEMRLKKAGIRKATPEEADKLIRKK